MRPPYPHIFIAQLNLETRTLAIDVFRFELTNSGRRRFRTCVEICRDSIPHHADQPCRVRGTASVARRRGDAVNGRRFNETAFAHRAVTTVVVAHSGWTT